MVECAALRATVSRSGAFGRRRRPASPAHGGPAEAGATRGIFGTHRGGAAAGVVAPAAQPPKRVSIRCGTRHGSSGGSRGSSGTVVRIPKPSLRERNRPRDGWNRRAERRTVLLTVKTVVRTVSVSNRRFEPSYGRLDVAIDGSALTPEQRFVSVKLFIQPLVVHGIAINNDTCTCHRLLRFGRNEGG
jgi:hypothetical protein